MDFRSVKNLMIGGKAVSKLLVGGRLVWKKAEPEPGQAYDYEVEYVETDGVSSYMDIGIVPDVLTSYEIDVMYEGGKYTGTSTLRNCAYGCATGTSTTSASHVLYFRETDGFIKFAKPTSNLFTELVPGVRFKVSVSAAVDGKSSISVGDHAETVTNTYTAATTMKFGCSYTESPEFYAMARFHGAKFWKDGVLVRDLVPVVKDGEAGLYDKVGNVFYGNASGSGSIVAGPEVVQKTPYIETDGVASYMDLGFVPTENCSLEVCAKLFPIPDRTAFQVLMSASYGRTDRFTFRYHATAKAIQVTPGSIKVSDYTDPVKGVYRYSNGVASFNGEEAEISFAGSSWNMLLGIFAGTNYQSNTRFYYAKFWESGVLIRDLVPYSGPRGVGLLDKVHDVLYTNAGGGTLTYGEEGGAWTNPYITDGLLGMWDAEWNEAGGVHNPDLMQLNDLTGNLFPMPVAVLGDKWASRSENPSFSYADHPSLALFFNSEGYREHTVEGYSSFDPSLDSISGNKYAFASLLNLKNASSGASGTAQLGYGLISTGKCANLRGFAASVVSEVDGADGVGRTFSSSTINKPGGVSVGYLDGVEYGRYVWTTGNVYSYVNTFTFGATGSYWDKIRTSCVRIYNRALTPEEVAHNARVDRERFGS